MKILHVIPSISKHSGGPAQAIWEFIRVASNEHTFTVISTNENLSNSDLLDLNRNNQVDIKTFNFLGKHSFKFSFGMIVWFLSNYRFFDVIHIHAGFSFLSEIIALISLIGEKKMVYRPLGTLSPYSLSVGNKWLKKIMLPFEKWILSNARFVHCTSKSEANDIQQLVAKVKTVIIPPSFSVEFNSKSLGNKVKTNKFFTIGFLSRIDPKKNVEFLLELSKDLPDSFKLVIAGDDKSEYVQQLKTFCDRNELNHKVSWLGFLSGNEKLEFLERIDCFVLPSYHENFGIAAAEALFNGKPILISPYVNISDFGTSSAVITNELNRSVWMKALEEIKSNLQSQPDWYRNEAIMFMQKHFSDSVIQEKLSYIYSE